MLLNVTRSDLWAASVEDKPGGLSQKLEPLALAGIDLEFIIACRCHSKPNTGVVFVTPIQGESHIQAARAAGFAPSQTAYATKIEGPDEPGIVSRITRALADGGLNLRGLSAARIGSRCVIHLAFDTAQDADRVANLVRLL